MRAIKIGFVSRHEPESLQLVQMLIRQIKSLEKTTEILVDEDIASQIGIVGASVELMEESRVDFIISVGGDGTILRTIHKMKDPVPILGINMGTLGFLVDVEPKDALKALQHLLNGFEVDERSRLQVLLNDGCLPPATNEVALLTASPAKMIEFEDHGGWRTHGGLPGRRRDHRHLHRLDCICHVRRWPNRQSQG